MTASHHPYENPTSLEAGLRCRCPRCGEGKLFRSFLKIADHCDRCGLDYGFADPADGPAFFVMSGVSIAVMAVWAWSVVAFQPPIWLQFATVFPALFGGALATLQPVKAWLVAEQYLHKAEEARWDSIGGHGEGGFTYDRRGVSDRRST
ncbi:MAG: DUF983 domain-containing protein [Phenylobacterium sp.]|uniref:DUF983 domain-containing protein n=1 Tax=Phenylobacterium sp. TaxID=1871053 RepID=UPI00121D5471|nr:DUF983 domain-containing protein [Phenylobacterium sp.]TAL29931.1 MAG: DUF983 domain-containing protein [Phenylobacterium sp.]